MPTLLVLADTHIRTWEQLAPAIAQAIPEVDAVVHCGDYTSPEFMAELRRRSRRFLGVYGNTDPRPVRQELPEKLTLEIGSRKIAITHPSWGGPPWGLEEELLRLYPSVDVLLFGHTHEPLLRHQDHTLLVNPGQGYPVLGFPATYVLLTLEEGEIRGEIKEA